MKEQVDLEVQETNEDFTNYKTLVYNGDVYDDYIINFDGTDVYDVRNNYHVSIYESKGCKVFNVRKPNSDGGKGQTLISASQARVDTFYNEILVNIDRTHAKTLIYKGVRYDRYLIFPNKEPKILDLKRLEFLKYSRSVPCSKNSTVYWIFSLNENGKSVRRFGHIATMWTFNGPPLVGMINPTVDHIDGNGLNNDPSNLRWLSLKDNIKFGHIKISDDTVRAFCRDLSDVSVEYCVDELCKKHGLPYSSGRAIYYRKKRCDIVLEFPEFPKRPIYKRKQKAITKTLF